MSAKSFMRTALLAGAAFLAAVGTAHSQGAPIKIGSFLAATGGASFLGDPEMKTLKLYVDLINKQGGVLGRQLELVAYDTGGDAKQAATFVKRLLEEDKVDAIVGGTTTGETMAVIPLVEAAGVPLVSLGGGNPIVEPAKKWVFKTPHSDRMAVEKIYYDMKNNGIVKVAIIGGPGAFDQSCRAQAKAVAPKWGMTVVADETYGGSDTDVTPQLTKIKNTVGVQGIVGCGFGAITSITAKNYKQLGMKLPFYFNHGVGSKQFIDGAAGAAEGIRLPAAALLVAEQLPANDVQKAVAMDYMKTYTGHYKEPVSTFGGHAYDGLMLVVEAMKRANSTDKAKVRDEIEKTKNFIGADGIFNMSPTDHMGLDLKSFKMLEVRNNNWTLLY